MGWRGVEEGGGRISSLRAETASADVGNDFVVIRCPGLADEETSFFSPQMKVVLCYRGGWDVFQCPAEVVVGAKYGQKEIRKSGGKKRAANDGASQTSRIGRAKKKKTRVK